MAYASNSERLALKNANDFGLDYVIRFRKGERESELACDDLDHAFNLSDSWLEKGADYIEIFRVLHDGSLNSTIGPMHGQA